MNSRLKKEENYSISQAIFAGAVVMVVVFLISLFLPKQWLISGKIVVFPSGQPASASQTTALEVNNTAEIINSESFQKNNFGNKAADFAGAEVLKDSSMVLVKFRSSENDIQFYEDLIVKIPSRVSEYTRDLYEGTPFKYKMAADPEISANPVRPNLLLNSIFGFIAGFAIYLIYWYRSEGDWSETSNTSAKKEKKSEIVSPKIEPTSPTDSTSLATEEKKIGEGTVEMKNNRSHFVPRKASGEQQSTAPENLPFVDESTSSDEIAEPTDEEVKERLNRLMRGDL